MEPFSIEESTTLTGARIVAVGVGGGGGNMIGYMLKEAIPGIELIIANTDAQVLEQGSAATKIQLGAKLTKGLGAGMKPEVGKESALESYEDLARALAGADIVFVAAGLGGGTGTGAAPIIAKIAKEVGALTIAVVTKPFSFEGKKRLKLAEDGLQELKNESDCIVVIPNDKLLSIIDPKLGIKESFRIVDSVLARAVSGTSGVILASGDNDINLDFADLKTVMSHRGLALMGVGEYKGENAAYEAIKNAIESPLLDNMSVNGALGVLVHFSMHPEFPFMELSAAMDVVHNSVDESADVIFGTTTDANLDKDFIRITLVATGFDKKAAMGINNSEFENKEVLAAAAAKPRVVIRPAMVANGDYSEDFLDVPTFMRQQKD
ncbi:cell division protein FtsZ [Sulfuricurvum sp.]|uniref:cell division protein FtsZ n=1 Tax=Sulfuricurvum sp. TaxID=2025608 RepID=UPI00261EEBD8|nr:cell division protein FtsZ [Sulfuricurvum sp.]MDD2266938.1 cell division protein FtsZ [Sulfuricurvum sp.]MDD2783616.1 cell division protein FtsZ [Sulfuricurvum sp.]HZF69937.1 cell division protein FtsZ [Sulfuricurvum sp.]